MILKFNFENLADLFAKHLLRKTQVDWDRQRILQYWLFFNFNYSDSFIYFLLIELPESVICVNLWENWWRGAWISFDDILILLLFWNLATTIIKYLLVALTNILIIRSNVWCVFNASAIKSKKNQIESYEY